jgi:hypothetical protein
MIIIPVQGERERERAIIKTQVRRETAGESRFIRLKAQSSFISSI